MVSSVVIAAVEPKNIVVFFLPVHDDAKVNSPRRAVKTPVPSGISAGIGKKDMSKKDKHQKKHGIVTTVGVSLYDKGETPLKTATENVLSPARVLILPQERIKKTDSGKKHGLPESVIPDRIRIFPIADPVGEIKKEARERPAVIRYKSKTLPAPEDPRKQRPENESEWTNWILDQLQICNMDSRTVLPTLYWMTANKKLTDGKTKCDMKNAVAQHLKKCHPWPIIYYTPVNNDVPVRQTVQMAVEYLENDFDDQPCAALDLSSVNFAKVEFLQGNLKNANFSKSYFQEATFSDFDVSGAVFDQSLMDNVLFQNTDLSTASFENVRMKYAHFHRVKARSVKFDSADLQNTQFRDANLAFSSFPNAVLQNTAWQDVRAYRINASEANFTSSGFDNVLFDQMRADKANFAEIFCKDCVFSMTSLQYANFFKAVFENTSFDKSSMPYAQFNEAVFNRKISFDDVDLYAADFSHVDLTPFDKLPIEKLTKMKVDRKTVLPAHLSDFDSALFDEELMAADRNPMKNIDRYSCSKRVCEERLLGRASNQNLAVRAMTILSNPSEPLAKQVWAICTMGCIAKEDKKLENSQMDLLAYYIKRKRSWDAQTDLFRPYTPIEPEVQLALYVLTDPDIGRDLGHDVDLTGTDLRKADLSNSDLRMLNLAGSYLGGVDFRGSKMDRTYDHFDQAVIDEFTLFPEDMGLFKPFSMPGSSIPSWWKPETVRVIRDKFGFWSVTTEDIPFSDEFIIQPEIQTENEE